MVDAEAELGSRELEGVWRDSCAVIEVDKAAVW